MKKKAAKKSLTEEVKEMNDILRAAKLSEVCDTFDLNKSLKATFPRTIKDVLIVDSNKKKNPKIKHKGRQYDD